MLSRPDVELLGQVTVPSGTLVLVDPGLLWIWEGERDDVPETIDFHLEGADAEQAGRRFGRSCTPTYWYDIPSKDAGAARRQFGAFVASEGLDAVLVEVPGRVPHRKRVDLALDEGGGMFGTLEFFGIQSPVVQGLPRDRDLAVWGARMDDENFPDHWRWVTLEVEEGTTARTDEIATVFVDEGRLMFADADALDEWRHALTPMLASDTGSSVISIGGAKLCAFFTSWGDGAFPVLADFAADDRLLRLRVDLGSDETVERLRAIQRP